MEITKEMIEKAAEVASDLIVPYDTWWQLTPVDLAREMLEAALSDVEMPKTKE